MAEEEQNTVLRPRFQVKIGGSEISPEAHASLVSATVHQDVELPGMLTIKLLNWDAEKGQVTWSDDELFSEGGEIEISMGYGEELSKVIIGEITGLEPEFIANQAPMVIVRGYDLRHRLLRGTHTRTFIQIKDSDIVSQIADEAGIGVEAEDTSVTFDYVMQRNQTDMHFLQQRAKAIGYEIFINERTLLYRPPKHAEAEALTLNRECDVMEFYPRSSLVTQVGTVATRSWSVVDKEAISSQLAASDVSTDMGGEQTGPQRVESVFSGRTRTIPSEASAAQPRIDQLVQGQLETMALRHVSGEGQCPGRSDLQAGMVVLFEGFGTRFSGPYYITSTVHRYSPRQGYRTEFSFRRTAS